jgi:O-acetyl-ADP-ribose deacetylase (regulator of RNase III)
MPIIFISLSETFTQKMADHGYSAKTMKIEDYVPTRKTYYVSPANSLCFMDGGIDFALSRIIFPGIEHRVKDVVKRIGIRSIVGKPYLPIGSSIILDGKKKGDLELFLVVAPTMLLPQNVSSTNNAYYATMAILYNVLVVRGENLDDVDILFTSLCCGYGKMSEDDSIRQILRGINDYSNYLPKVVISDNIVICEPNLHEQPKYYQNTEFFAIEPKDIVNC